MLFRLLLTISLVGAWALPALGCGQRDTIISAHAHMFRLLQGALFPRTTSERGGGTWYDSEGREGTFVAKIRTRIRKVRECSRGRIGCYENAAFHHYTIELDDGRTEWFTWSAAPPVVIKSSSSSSGAVAMKFVKRTRTANGDQLNKITIVDGDYTLTLVEEKIDRVPNSITYTPRSSLRPVEEMSLQEKMEIIRY